MTENLFDDGVAEALQSRRQPEPVDVGEIGDIGGELPEPNIAIVHGDNEIRLSDLHAECVSRADYDCVCAKLSEIALKYEGLDATHLSLLDNHRRQTAEVRNLQSQLDAYVDSCARLTPAAKDHLQWLRERRAPIGGAMPDEDETLEWALERVVAKVKSDMGRKR